MVHIYSVTPETVTEADPQARDYPERLARTLAQAEGAQFRGILVPHNLREIDPWMVSSHIGAQTSTLRPLIAVQPAAIPPHTAAQSIAAFGALHGRALDINLVAGANPTELRVVGDSSSKEARYGKLRAWAVIVRTLLSGETVHWDDNNFHYEDLRLEPYLDVVRDCRFFMAGSSQLSQQVAAEIADVAVTHPLPFEEWAGDTLPALQEAGFTGDLGIRIGVLARERADAAWALAHERFPWTWAGEQETKLKTISPNTWSRQLATRAVAANGPGDAATEKNVYWLGAFANGAASAPMLVGTYDEVTAALAEYQGAGVNHVILTGIHDDDYSHTARVINRLRDKKQA